MGNGSRTIENTLRTLLEQHGPPILEQPMRLEAFLRDHHPEKPQMCFILLEVIHSGIVEKIRQTVTRLEHHQEEWVQLLSASSGISPKFGHECITLWTNALPADFFYHHSPDIQAKTEFLTLEDYLGPAAESALKSANSLGETFT